MPEELLTIARSAWAALPDLLRALPMTLGFAFAAMMLGLPLSLLVALGRLSLSPFWRGLCGLFVSFMRGTPLLVQLFIVYYGLPSFNVQLSPVVSGVLVLTLNAAAYLSETVRAAILGVGKGQREAAYSLGLSQRETMRFIVLPQAARLALPSLSNTLIGLIKDTSLVSVISVVELMYSAKIVMARTFEPFGPYVMAALMYWLICSLLELLQGRLERHFSRGFDEGAAAR